MNKVSIASLLTGVFFVATATSCYLGYSQGKSDGWREATIVSARFYEHKISGVRREEESKTDLQVRAALLKAFASKWD